MIVINNYINGEFIESTNHDTIDNFNPATNEKIATIPKSSAKDIIDAVDACKASQSSWSKLTIHERAEWLDKIADELNNRFEEIATLESLDTGKPISLARNVDATRSVINFIFTFRSLSSSIIFLCLGLSIKQTVIEDMSLFKNFDKFFTFFSKG